MIKTIKLIECTPYQQAEISDCRKINFIFGSNGSGKSTISSFLSGDVSSRFENSSVEWEGDTHETICVYNRSFRRKNLRQTIPGIFTLGSATIEDIQVLEQMKKDLSQKREEWEKKCETYRRQTQMAIPAREARFRDDVWNQILKKNELDFQKAFDGLRASKEKFVNELKKRIVGIPGHKGKVCLRGDLIIRAKALYVNKPEHCARIEMDIDQWLTIIDATRNDPIWNTVISGNKDIDIAALIKELGNSHWVDQGRKYIIAGSMTCPFCQQETITEAFRDKLEAFFDRMYISRIEKMKCLLENYHMAANQIITAIEAIDQMEAAISIGKLDIEKITAKKDLLKTVFLAHEKQMEGKISEPGIIIEIPDVSMIIQDIVGSIETANTKIDSHNKLVDDRKSEEETLTDDVWVTIISDAAVLIKTYQEDIADLNRAAQGLKRTIDSQKKELERLENAIVEKGKNITSVQPTIDEINRSLRAYGFTNFSIQPADGQENQYCIKREDGTLATGTLSEGEETFLSFLYFMQWTKGSADPEHVSDKKIIVLDDPISSLDSTVLYIVGAMVKDLSRRIKNNEGDVSQLFVLTHNVFFHKEASFDPRQSMGKNIKFLVIRKDNNISIINDYGQNNPISTSYELLWAELRENKNISQISIQNAMRRIIENYFGMLGTGKDDTILSHFETAEEQMIAKSLLYWINDGSHSIPDDLHIDSYTDAVPKYRAVFEEIFKVCGHLSHYNMMMKIDGN